MMLLAFSFAVFDFIYGLPAWNRLFEGLGMLCQTGRGSVCMNKKTHRLKNFTLTFLVIRYSLAVIPELSILSSQKYDDSAFDWSEFTELFRGMAMFVVFVLGIVWLSVYLVRMRKICRDGEFFDACLEKYNVEILARPNIFTRRRIKSVLAVMCVAFFFAFDFDLDDINLLPDALFFIAAIITFVLLRNFDRINIAGIILSVSGICMSVIGEIASYNYHQMYTDAIARRNPEAWTAFWKFSVFDILSSLLFIAVSAMLLAGVKKIIDNHCGYIPQTMSGEYRESKLREIRRGLYGKLILCGIFALLSGIAGAMYDYMITSDTMLISDLWMPGCIILNACVFVSAIAASSAVKAEADSRYMLD